VFGGKSDGMQAFAPGIGLHRLGAMRQSLAKKLILQSISMAERLKAPSVE